MADHETTYDDEEHVLAEVEAVIRESGAVQPAAVERLADALERGLADYDGDEALAAEVVSELRAQARRRRRLGGGVSSLQGLRPDR